MLTLPSFYTWDKVFEIYENERNGDISSTHPRCSKSQFDRIRGQNGHFNGSTSERPLLKIRKRMKEKTCKQCLALCTSLVRCRVPAQMKLLRGQYREHILLQQRERQLYYTARMHAKTNPRDSLCMIIDGMTSYTTAQPHLPRQDGPIDYKLTGVLVHGFGFYMFTNFGYVKSGANLTIDILMRVLTMLSKKTGFQFPRKLHLQGDSG